MTPRNVIPGARVEVRSLQPRWPWPGAEEAEIAEEWRPAIFIEWKSKFFGHAIVRFKNGLTQAVKRGDWRIAE